LPEAHVEAPTIGSVILAAFLLKVGGYGVIRFVFTIFPFATYYMLPVLNILCLLGVVYSALTALRQIDVKRIIAYSSVSHMNLGILGLASYNLQGFEGCFFLMLAHGFVSGGLFFLVGVLYDRVHTKLIGYYGGLCQVMPVFSTFFFFFTLANFSFPGTANFIGEFLLLVGILKNNIFIFIVSCFGVFVGACFSILIFNKLVFGSIKIGFSNLKITDVNRRESFVLAILLLITLFIGIYPNIILNDSYFTLKFFLVKSLS
jgi:NADH-quinone oxidoreductase subunit M